MIFPPMFGQPQIQTLQMYKQLAEEPERLEMAAMVDLPPAVPVEMVLFRVVEAVVEPLGIMPYPLVVERVVLAVMVELESGCLVN